MDFFMFAVSPLKNVLAVTEILTAQWGFAWSPKRITISTVGIRRELKRLIEDCECHIAISLHAPNPEKRRELIPAEKAFSMTEMLEILKRYDFAHQRRLSFEYTMFKGENDQIRHIQALAKLLEGLECRINLIRYHSVPESGLMGTEIKQIEWFRDELNKRGITTTIRKSRGEDIYAACGLLSTKKKNSYEKL